MVYLKNYSRE